MEIDAPAPEGDILSESQREARAVIDKANHLQQQASTAESATTAAGSSAWQELQGAEANLDAAKVVDEDDSQVLAGGGSKVAPEDQNRVQAAEKSVEEACKQLDQDDWRFRMPDTSAAGIFYPKYAKRTATHAPARRIRLE